VQLCTYFDDLHGTVEARLDGGQARMWDLRTRSVQEHDALVIFDLEASHCCSREWVGSTRWAPLLSGLHLRYECCACVLGLCLPRSEVISVWPGEAARGA
jgi:hypothetical protein